MLSRYTIYRCQCRQTRKSYVGVTSKSLTQRFDAHVYDSEKKNSRSVFHAAIRKYGKHSFECFVLDVLHTKKAAKHAERIWIRELNTMIPNGYNMTAGGDGFIGLIFSKEHRQNLSIAAQKRELRIPEAFKAQWRKSPSQQTREKIRKSQIGRVKSDVERQKLSIALTNRRFSEEALRRMSLAQQRRFATSEPHKLSAEHRKRIRESNRKRVISQETRNRMSQSQKKRFGRTS